MVLLLGWAYNVCRDGAGNGFRCTAHWPPILNPFAKSSLRMGLKEQVKGDVGESLKNGYLQNLRSRPPMCRHRTQGRKLGSLGAARDTEVLRVSLSPFLLCPFEGSDALDGLGEAGDNACRAPTRAEPSSVRVTCMERRTYFPSFRNAMHCLATRENDRHSHQNT